MKKTSFFILLLSFMLVPLATLVSADEKKQGAYLGSKTATHPTWFKESFLNLEEDIADSKENNKRLVVYFWQPGCPYCNQLWEDNFSQPETVAFFRNNFEIVALNIWGDREVVSVSGKDYTEKSFAAALGIKYTPTLLFFNEDRKVIHQLNGYIPPKNFRQSLEYVAAKHEKKMRFAEYTVSLHKDDEKTGALHEEDFFKRDFNLQKNLAKDKYLAVIFENSDCTNCDIFHQKTLQDKTTRDLLKQFNTIQLNRYADTSIVTPSGNNLSAKSWATQLGISYLPAMVFFNSQGKEVMRIDAQMRTFHIQSVFDYVLTGAYKTELNFQRYISARADKIREQGIDVDIFAY